MLRGRGRLSISAFGSSASTTLSIGDEEAHRVLLGAGVVAVEGLDLREVEPGGYRLVCAPLKLEGAEGAPARVLLLRD